jgi:hypothetical protein
MIEEYIEKFKGMKKCCLHSFLIILSLFLVVLIVSGAVDIKNKIKEGKYIGQGIEAKNTITISDSGEIYAKPDLALVDFSVVTEAKAVSKALSDNTEKMNAVINFIKGESVDAKDLKTTSFNIYPQYEWYKETSCEVYPCPEGKRVLVGYEVTQQLEVKIRDLLKIGEIIEGATAAGANQVGNLYFTIDKEEDLKKQARDEAIKKAKAKAQELADQLGVKLVRITNFSESGIFPVPSPYYKGEALGLGGGSETPQIETGENKIEVTVSITYEID